MYLNTCMIHTGADVYTYRIRIELNFDLKKEDPIVYNLHNMISVVEIKKRVFFSRIDHLRSEKWGATVPDSIISLDGQHMSCASLV